MPELAMVVQKLESIESVQKALSSDVKELSKGFSILAAQSEQLTYLNSQTEALWRKYDGLIGPESVIEKLREHQKGCPRDEMHQTFSWVWKVISLHSLLIISLIGWILHISEAH